MEIAYANIISVLGCIIWREVMLEWYLDINKLLREIRKKAINAQDFLRTGDSGNAELINGSLKTDYQLLQRLWRDQDLDAMELNNLKRHINYGEDNDYRDIIVVDLADVETIAEKHAREGFAPKG